MKQNILVCSQYLVRVVLIAQIDKLIDLVVLDYLMLSTTGRKP